MSLRDDMLALERVRRRPQDLEREAAAHPTLRDLDPARLRAVSRSFARHVLGRWWQPRFGATFAQVADPGALAEALIADDGFERAVGEDETAGVLIKGLLDLRAKGTLEAPEWLEDLLTYEYLLEVGLPHRAQGLPLDAEAEARLFAERVRWFEGGRLALPLAIGQFAVDVIALREGETPREGCPPLAFGYDDEGALEVGLSYEAADALELYAGGASDAVIDEAFGEDGPELRAVLFELGFVQRSVSGRLPEV
ncbi:MAG: hypothetical protein R3F62_19095 [Planctomycetota bacterium]